MIQYLAPFSLIIFTLSYIMVMMEEFTHLRKSKPMLLCAGILWVLVAIAGPVDTNSAFKHNFLEFAELFFFLVVAMTYINAIEERQVFATLKTWMVKKQLSYKTLFWLTGFLAFFISPLADNMTTALIMCAIVTTVGIDKPKFVTLACINIVVAANAGGAFCPFGDITTLMVWQKGILPFQDFFKIFLPSLVSFIIPASIMQFAVPTDKPLPVKETVQIAKGGKRIVLLFLCTILTTVCFHHFFHLPPVAGMMMGLGFLQLFGFYLKNKKVNTYADITVEESATFDIFRKFHRIEWDTLLFFYGVMLCVGALGAFGYLQLASETMYHDWGQHLSEMHRQTPANIMIGILSAIVDNIPLMFAVLTMSPEMSEGQWLLVTLTAGIGGSLLSVGSAAGVALMGQAKGRYTFFGHLRWTWAIAIGYFSAIGTHLWLNRALF